MKTSSADDKKKLAVITGGAVLAVGYLGYMYTQIFPSTSSAPPPVSTASGTPSGSALTPTKSGSNPSEKPLAITAAALDPTLRMGPMLTAEALVYKGVGRNIFSGETAPAAALPRPVASARPTSQQAVYTPPSGPPAPPPIDLRFFGTATSSTHAPRAFLLHGEDVFLASAGDIIQRRYKILAINANSITVQDLVNNNQQSLPLRLN